MGDNEFDKFMTEQIKRIRSLRHRLRETEDREVSMEEAARTWISNHAKKFRKFRDEDSSKN